LLEAVAVIIALANAPLAPAPCSAPAPIISTSDADAPAAKPSTAPPRRGDAPIPWRATHPLRWSDFRGRAPAESDHSAETATTLRMQAAVKIVTLRNGTQWECVVSLRELTTEALFEPAKSWVRSGHTNAELLAHEQLHFDLAHLQARHGAARAVRELAPQTFTARAPSEELAVSTARAKFDRALERFTREEQDALSERNRRYDAETGHGTKSAEQERWAKTIERELRELGVPRRPRRS